MQICIDFYWQTAILCPRISYANNISRFANLLTYFLSNVENSHKLRASISYILSTLHFIHVAKTTISKIAVEISNKNAQSLTKIKIPKICMKEKGKRKR
jgi:hypothetical protein